MIGIDTNILVRLLTRDSVTQAKKANLLLTKEEKIFVPTPVILETVWVLEESYEWKKEDMVLTLETLLEIENFVFEDKASISHATWAYRNGGDWSDHLIQALCKKHHCTSLATFDRKFAQFYPDFVKLLS